jgi:hypothetical protein
LASQSNTSRLEDAYFFKWLAGTKVRVHHHKSGDSGVAMAEEARAKKQ